MSHYNKIQQLLREKPLRWLVTGVAGFIGSNLLEQLLRVGQTVIGLDDLSTGYRHNLEDVRKEVGDEAWANFTFIEGDIRNAADCAAACDGVDYVLHQAALGSVPRSIKDPLATHQVNVDGFVNMLIAARDAGVKRFVYASSSSVYGDHPGLPKVEDEIGTPLSPYAVSKRTNELYAKTFFDHYGLETIGLRYFNVFGRRQDPDGAYAAVIPKWIGQMLKGERTTLNELHAMLKEGLEGLDPSLNIEAPVYADFRPGDVRHSLADISRAAQRVGYGPMHPVGVGLREAMAWYREHGVTPSASV